MSLSLAGALPPHAVSANTAIRTSGRANIRLSSFIPSPLLMTKFNEERNAAGSLACAPRPDLTFLARAAKQPLQKVVPSVPLAPAWKVETEGTIGTSAASYQSLDYAS